MEQVKKSDYHEEPDLRGTAFFVSLLGGLIAFSVIGALYLFITRGLTFLVM